MLLLLPLEDCVFFRGLAGTHLTLLENRTEALINFFFKKNLLVFTKGPTQSKAKSIKWPLGSHTWM